MHTFLHFSDFHALAMLFWLVSFRPFSLIVLAFTLQKSVPKANMIFIGAYFQNLNAEGNAGSAYADGVIKIVDCQVIGADCRR